MEAALIGLLGSLVNVFMSARFQAKEQRRKEISALAEFLESLAQLLLGMQEKLSKSTVPTYEGNRLKELLQNYKETIARSKVTKAKRKELEGMLPRLETLLTTAEFEDKVLRGSIIRYDPEPRERLLLELQRSAARLGGMSTVLKASAGIA
jgi:hypothetical protein